MQRDEQKSIFNIPQIIGLIPRFNKVIIDTMLTTTNQTLTFISVMYCLFNHVLIQAKIPMNVSSCLFIIISFHCLFHAISAELQQQIGTHVYPTVTRKPL